MLMLTISHCHCVAHAISLVGLLEDVQISLHLIVMAYMSAPVVVRVCQQGAAIMQSGFASEQLLQPLMPLYCMALWDHP